MVIFLYLPLAPFRIVRHVPMGDSLSEKAIVAKSVWLRNFSAANCAISVTKQRSNIIPSFIQSQYHLLAATYLTIFERSDSFFLATEHKNLIRRRGWKLYGDTGC